MNRAKSSVFLFIYGLIQMFEYFILVYFLSHKLAHPVKDDFKRFLKGSLDFFAAERGIPKNQGLFTLLDLM